MLDWLGAVNVDRRERILWLAGSRRKPGGGKSGVLCRYAWDAEGDFVLTNLRVEPGSRFIGLDLDILLDLIVDTPLDVLELPRLTRRKM